MLLDAWFGVRLFHWANPDRFRHWVILVLAALSLVSLAKALLAMLGDPTVS